MKHRYIQDSVTGKLHEVDLGYSAPLPDSQHLLWNDRDYKDLKTSDGVDISSRAKHKEYMKRTGLTTMDDYKETWAKAQAKREEYQAKGGSVSREDVARAIHKLESDSRRPGR
jgi:hypothetical protein